MLFNRLDYLYQRIEDPLKQAIDVPTCLHILDEINAEIQEVLDNIRTTHQRYHEKTVARQAMQQWLKPSEGVPDEAIRMYLSDQIDFYQELVADMMAFFTGSERRRCVAFALSVEELLFMIRLLLEEKLMETNALKPIFLFLSRYASTTGSATLSYESLRKKYSGINPTAKRNVKRLLANMMGRVERYEQDG